MNKINALKRLYLISSISIPLTLVACGSNPPTEQISVAEHLIRESDINKSTEYAPLEIRIARENLDAAKAALAAGHNDEAKRLAEKVAVDVETAGAKADSVRAKNAVDELQKSIRTLSQEIDSKSNF
ncbi:MAG: DUF4398 domain-containing protein [Methylococcaceae bacterium]|jgi:hypothetical protein